MYRGFNLKLDDYSLFDNYIPKISKDYYFQDIWDEVQDNLDDFLDSTNSLDGTAIQDYWFPKIEADIFISHSHRDEDLAIYLACWLEDTFDLKVFIDSQVWGYGDNLIKELYDEYGADNIKEYNQITSHVHMMLSTALTRMIDKCEAIFFLNTPNSINADDIIDKTYSPWIYHEIAVTQMIRKRKLRKDNNGELKPIQENVNLKYKVSLEHLYSLDKKNLIKWRKEKEEGGFYASNNCKYRHSLDCLYENFPLKRISNYQNLYG